MFLELVDFCSSVLARVPSVAMVSWQRHEALSSFIHRFEQTLLSIDPNLLVRSINCKDMGAIEFAHAFVVAIEHPDASRICFVFYGVEALAIAAGRILNGFRERITHARAVVVVIREDRKRDFMLQAPDLMDWIGTMVTRAEDMEKPFTNEEINTIISRFEQRYELSTKAFRKKWDLGKAIDIPDAWLWRELILMKEELEKQ
jgi:hypothetical protein